MKKEIFIRNCPSCNRELTHTNKKNRNDAVKKGRLCSSCAAKIVQNDPAHKRKQAEYRRKAYKGDNNPFYGKKHTIETIEKIQKNRDASSFKTQKFKDKMSKVTSGKNNPMCGRNYYDVWVDKYGKEEANNKMNKLKKEKSLQTSGKNNPMYGKPSPQGSGNGWSGWYKGWFFRSIKELSYMINIIEAKKLKWRTAETNDLAVRYINYDGSERTYRADFLVEEKELIEVKPIKLFNTPNNLLKKKAAISFCRKNGYNYKIVDVKLLDVKKMKNLYGRGEIKFTKKYEEKYKKYIKGMKT